MASYSMKHPARRVLTAAILGALLAGGLAVPKAEAADLGHLDASLRLIPDDAAFYGAMLRNREQIEAIADSNAWARLTSLPYVQFFVQMYQMQAANPNSPPGQLQAALNDPEVRELVDLGCDMLSHEVFIYGDETSIDCVALMQEVYVAVRYWADLLRLTGQAEGMTRDEVRLSLLLGTLAENTERLQIPGMVFGFKVSNTDAAEKQFAKLEAWASAAVENQPHWQRRLAKIQVAGHRYLSLSLDGDLIPWDDLPLDELEELEAESGDVDRVVARLKELTLVIAVGLRDDYLLVLIGPSTDCLAELGRGRPLIGRPELKPLEPFAGQRLTRITYSSKRMMECVSGIKEDLDELPAMVDELLLLADLTRKQKRRIRRDAAALAEDLKRLTPEPGAVTAFSFLTDRGIEEYQYDWGEHLYLDGSEPLGVLQHVGGSPLLAVVGRCKGSLEDYDLLVKWLEVGYGYFEEYALPEMEEEDRQQFEALAELAGPLVRRANRINRTMLVPALADGQLGFVLDAKLTSKQLVKALPPTDEPMPVPEMAIVIGVSDAKLLRKACGKYREVFDDLVDAVRQIEPDAVPEDYAIPDPETITTESGTIYGYKLPKWWGLDDQIVPNLGLSETVAVLSLSHGHTRRLLTPTPLKTEGVLADPGRPRAAVVVLDWAGLVDAVTPWVDLALETITGEQPQTAVTAPGSVTAQVHAVLEVLKVLRGVTSESYFQDGALVTHTLTEIRDLPE